MVAAVVAAASAGGSALTYYEGLFPEPATDMRVTSVTPGPYPTVYLRWQDVQFTVKVRNAVGWPLLADLVRDIPGRNVIVEIDSVNDNATITVSAEGSASAHWLAFYHQKRLYGDLGWAIRVRLAAPRVDGREHCGQESHAS